MSSYTGVFGDYTVSPSSTGFLPLSIANDYTLFWPSPGNNIPSGSTTQATIASYNNIIATAADLDVALPDATKVSTGTSIVFTNVGGGGDEAFNLNKYDGSLLINITVGSSFLLYLTDNSTQAGSFTIVPNAGGTNAVTSIGLDSDIDNNGNISVSSSDGNPLTSAGTFTLTLDNDLLALVGFGGGTGYSARTAANTWALRTFTGTTDQIVVTNPAGVAGNTNIALAPVIKDITSIELETGLTLAGNVITGDDPGNIELTPAAAYSVEITRGGLIIDEGALLYLFEPAGTFYTSLQAGDLTANIQYVLPTVAPAVDQVLSVSSVGPPNVLQWATVPVFPGVSTLHAIARYADLIGSLDNSGVIISNANAITGATSLTSGNVVIAANAITTTAGALTIDPNGASKVIITDITYPYASDAGNIESCVLTMDDNDEIVFSANVNENLLMNGAMDIWQKGTSFTSASFFINDSGIYTADGWWFESGINGGDVNDVVDIEKTAGVFDSATCSVDYVMQFTVVSAGNKFGVFQFLEASKTAKVAGQTTSFSFLCKSSAVNPHIRAALVSWEGAADTLTKPIVATWNAAGTNPDLDTDYTYLGGVPQNTVITANLVRYKFEGIAVPDTCINLGLFVWYDDATALAATAVSISALKAEQGPTCTAFKPVDIELESVKCQRWIRKSWPLATPVGTAATLSAKAIVPAAVSPIGDTLTYGTHRFDYEMRATPATLNLFSVGAVANVATELAVNGTAGAAQPANSAIVLLKDATGFTIKNGSGGNITSASTAYLVHYYAEAGL